MNKEPDIFEKSLSAAKKYVENTPKEVQQAHADKYLSTSKPHNFNRMQRFIKRHKCVNDEIKHLKEEIERLQIIINNQNNV